MRWREKFISVITKNILNIIKKNKCESTTLKICLGSCGKCGSNYERNEPNVTEKEIAKNQENKNTNECKDKITNCDYFARAGMCTVSIFAI